MPFCLIKPYPAQIVIVRLNPDMVVVISNNSQGGDKLARSNYQFNKRQKELARKKKKEEKRQLKLNKNTIKSEDNENQSQDEEETL